MEISLGSAIVLTNVSENTFRRRIADGMITRTIEKGPNGRVMLPFDAIRFECCVPFEDEDFDMILAADNGNADAQNNLALHFLSHKKAKNAIYWLELASKQKHTDSMHWLGRCYIEGNGMVQDENLGFMWLSRAASEGHLISQEMMQFIRRKAIAAGPDFAAP